MAVQLLQKLFTVEEYNQMSKAGILCEGYRLELIEEELVQMAAIGNYHAAGCANRIHSSFIFEKITNNPYFVGAGSPEFLPPTNNLNKPAPPHPND